MAELGIHFFILSSPRASAPAGQISGQRAGGGMFAPLLIGPTGFQT